MKLGIHSNIQGTIQIAQEKDIKIISKIIRENAESVMKPFHSDRVLTHIQEYNSEKNLKKQLLWKDVFIYQEGGVIFGTIALVNFGTSEQLSKYSISNLFVTPKAQGRGIGTKLLEYIIQNAKINNIYILHVPSSRNAIGFYEKFGFKVNQEQPDISDEITWMHKNITSFDNI